MVTPATASTVCADFQARHASRHDRLPRCHRASATEWARRRGAVRDRDARSGPANASRSRRGNRRARRSDTEDRSAELRAEIPPPQRREFDTLLGEARLLNRLRDERDLLADGTAEGIARRAILTAGQSLTASGTVDDTTPTSSKPPSAKYEACSSTPTDRQPVSSPIERRMPAASLTPKHPFSSALRRRGRRRRSGCRRPWPTSSAPWISDSTRSSVPRLTTRARRFGGSALAEASTPAPPASYRGTADFSRVRPGDVLIAAGTRPAFNVLLPLIAAIVTDSGALLSHGAIVAREAGIPGVVRCGTATTRIPDGAIVHVGTEHRRRHRVCADQRALQATNSVPPPTDHTRTIQGR